MALAAAIIVRTMSRRQACGFNDQGRAGERSSHRTAERCESNRSSLQSSFNDLLSRSTEVTCRNTIHRNRVRVVHAYRGMLKKTEARHPGQHHSAPALPSAR